MGAMPPAPQRRPDPDALLARVEAQALQSHRGRLKVFFGASPGVGKTFAMLLSARRMREQGRDVVIGIVETHGRAETLQLVSGLDQLPRRRIEYRGRMLEEFDLDAALARKPAVLLLDELAHSNVPGGRHPKRWQDVEELLDAGIEVHTTLNVQHLESLNDIVGNITGIRVAETVPDRVFDGAEEVVLVDLPAEDLLQRLKEGKVYVSDQAKTAVANFFRRGNLLALRELALRRTAERVDDEMRSYRHEHSAQHVWQAQDAVLVCVGPEANAEKVVRAAARLAAALDSRWHAIYVETPALARLSESHRHAILRTLALAETLGATTATVPSVDAVAAAVEYARTHNLAKVVTGRRPRSRTTWLPWRRSFTREIARRAPDLDLLTISTEPLRPAPAGDGEEVRQPVRWRNALLALGLCAVATGVALMLSRVLDQANIVMLFMLAVVAAALSLGRMAAALTAVVSVLCFDFFFVTPYLSFAVSDVQYLVSFAVMLIVGIVVAELVTRLRYQARVANYREERAANLFAFARELSSALAAEQIKDVSRRVVGASFRAKVALLALGEDDELQGPADQAVPFDAAIARLVLDRGEPAGPGTDTLPAAAQLYVPLRAPMRTRGVLVVAPDNARLLRIPEQRRLLDTYAALIGMALERVHFVTVAQRTLVDIESERLRNSLLGALSHDLRTPLTVLVSRSEALASSLRPEDDDALAAAGAIRMQALQMSRLVENILEMARLQGRGVALHSDWQSMEELVGAALAGLHGSLDGRPVELDLPADLPLVRCDGRMIERVLVNLLENATKYTPPGTRIGIAAHAASDRLVTTVRDEGPGIQAGQEQIIFEKFRRGERESTIPGVGLGLAIARTIVEAHGGSMRAYNRTTGGAAFEFSLPLGPRPQVQEDDASTMEGSAE